MVSKEFDLIIYLSCDVVFQKDVKAYTLEKDSLPNLRMAIDWEFICPLLENSLFK